MIFVCVRFVTRMVWLIHRKCWMMQLVPTRPARLHSSSKYIVIIEFVLGMY